MKHNVMKTAVIGPGAIGGLIAGYLKEKGNDIFLLGRGTSVSLIREKGLFIRGARGDKHISIDIYEKPPLEPDLYIVCTKTQDVKSAVESLPHSSRTLFLTTQNGLQAENIISEYIDTSRILSGIVMFGATSTGAGSIVHNFEGELILGSRWGEVAQRDEVRRMLEAAFSVSVSARIDGMKWLKVFVNANNCIPAILGESMQECFADLTIAEISVHLWREGLAIIRGAGVTLEALPGFPVERVSSLASLPLQQAAAVFSKIMQGLSKEPLYGSILQSIKRHRPTEIDFINGAFIRLAEEYGIPAPLNKAVVSLVHTIEKGGPFLTHSELYRQTNPLFS